MEKIAKIISLKKLEENNSFEYNLELKPEEAEQIKNSQNLVLFSEQDFETTNISQRGKNGKTKYFLIPKSVRKRINLRDKKIVCQRLDLNNKTFFIYIVNNEVQKYLN